MGGLGGIRDADSEITFSTLLKQLLADHPLGTDRGDRGVKLEQQTFNLTYCRSRAMWLLSELILSLQDTQGSQPISRDSF